jgi:hypothetical protein
VVTKESDTFVDYLSLSVDKEAGAKDILLGRPTSVLHKERGDIMAFGQFVRGFDFMADESGPCVSVRAGMV